MPKQYQLIKDVGKLEGRTLGSQKRGWIVSRPYPPRAVVHTLPTVSTDKQSLLRRLLSVSNLPEYGEVRQWLEGLPRSPVGADPC